MDAISKILRKRPDFWIFAISNGKSQQIPQNFQKFEFFQGSGNPVQGWTGRLKHCCQITFKAITKFESGSMRRNESAKINLRAE